MTTSDSASRIQTIKQRRVADNTRSVYNTFNAKLILYLKNNFPELLSTQFHDVANAHSPEEMTSRFITRTFLKPPFETPPIKFADLTADHFYDFLVNYKKQNGEEHSYTTYNSCRSALNSMFEDFEVELPNEFNKDSKSFFKGFKRTISSNIAQGQGKVVTGKKPMEYSLYKLLSKSFLQYRDPEYVFGHFFLSICWNLMCRASNAVNIRFSHLEWKEDALGVYFAQMKNDQTGERPRDPRHVYANPLNPSICPILAFGLYLICFPNVLEESDLFPGGSQYERFRHNLNSLFKKSDVASELHARGISPADLGTHSIRKGIATWLTSGSTVCPPITPVHLRLGWALPGVTGTYMRYEAAGDQYVGRAAAGLPILEASFATLPPFFIARTHAIDTAISLCFPTVPPAMQRIVEFSVASLVYHHDFLKSTLHPDHIVFKTSLFQQPDLVRELQTLVQCRISKPGDPISATGIPAHILHLVTLENMQAELSQVVPAINNIVPAVVNGVMDGLEERAIEANTITRTGARDIFSNVLQESGVIDMVAQLQNFREAVQLENLNTEVHSNQVYSYSNRLHVLPENFKWPKGTVLTAWQYWCIGSIQDGYPPLRKISSSDISNTQVKRRFSDFSYLNQKIEDFVKEKNEWIENPTALEVNHMYEIGKKAVSLPHLTSKNRKRRTAQLFWATVVKELRKLARNVSQE
jgi:integrase